MLLSILIVSYNTKELTLQTLDSIWQELSQNARLCKEVELIVVDNNSHDESVPALKRWFRAHDVTHQLLVNAQNTGFAGANNQAITASSGQYVWLLNSDTIVRPGAIATLLATFQAVPIDDVTAALQGETQVLDRLGILSPQLLNSDGTVQHHGGDLPNLGRLLAQFWFLDDIPVLGRLFGSTQHTGKRGGTTAQQLYRQGWVGGTAMMIRKEMLAEIGLLDEHIFMYGEDVELCLRAAHHHWDVAVQPRAEVVHIGSASSSSAKAIEGEVKGYIYIWAKHFKPWQMPIAKWIIKIGMLLRWLTFGTMSAYRSRAKVYQELWRSL